MTGIYSVTHSLTETISSVLRKGFHNIGELAGRTVNVLRNLPQHMQNNPYVAIGVFTTANTVFFTVANLFANWLDRVMENSSNAQEETNPETRSFRSFIIDGVAVGIPVLGLNVLLSKAARYPLSKVTLAAITTAAIAARIFLNRASSENGKKVDDKKKSPDAQQKKKLAEETKEKLESEKKKREAEATQKKEKPEHAQEKLEEVKKVESEEAEIAKKVEEVKIQENKEVKDEHKAETEEKKTSQGAEEAEKSERKAKDEEKLSQKVEEAGEVEQTTHTEEEKITLETEEAKEAKKAKEAKEGKKAKEAQEAKEAKEAKKVAKEAKKAKETQENLAKLEDAKKKKFEAVAQQESAQLKLEEVRKGHVKKMAANLEKGNEAVTSDNAPTTSVTEDTTENPFIPLFGGNEGEEEAAVGVGGDLEVGEDEGKKN